MGAEEEPPKHKRIKIEPPDNIKKEHKTDKENGRGKKDSKTSEHITGTEKKLTSRIVIKDLQNSSIFKSTISSTKTKTERTRERSRDKEKKRHKKHSRSPKSSDRKGDISDISLSDEETYRNYLEFYKGTDHHKDHRSKRERSRSREKDRDRWPRGSDREWDRGKDRMWDRDYYDREHERNKNHRRSRSRDRL